MMNSFILMTLFFLMSCQNQGKTDLIFSDLASGSGNPAINQNELLDLNSGPVTELEMQIILGDRYYMLNKFMDLFNISANQLAPGHRQITLYDQIRPALFEFGLMGGGCDFYASVNAWVRVPADPLVDPTLENNSSFNYKLHPGVTQEFWDESCWHFHRNYFTHIGIPTMNWTQPVVSSAARFAVVMRVCHLVTKNRIEPFLTQKMGFDLTSLPEFNTENLTRLMEVFHAAYTPKPNEIEALSQVKTLFPEIPTNAEKLEMWRTATQAVCQSPFWHYL